jgi:hypothetical protein
MTTEAIQAEKEARKVFRSVFCGNPDGPAALTWILNECGYFSQDPKLVDPLMVALANRILNKIGTVHEDNLFADTRARLENANDRDLVSRENQEEL